MLDRSDTQTFCSGAALPVSANASGRVPATLASGPSIARMTSAMVMAYAGFASR